MLIENYTAVLSKYCMQLQHTNPTFPVFRCCQLARLEKKTQWTTSFFPVTTSFILTTY